MKSMRLRQLRVGQSGCHTDSCTIPSGFPSLSPALQRSVVLDALSMRDYSWSGSPRAFMCLPKLHAPLRVLRFLLPLVPCLFLPPPPALCQDSGSEGTLFRGDKAEISMTVRDSSGEAISAPASVKVYREGMPIDRKEASHGRAFFILRSLGDYTLVVDATGYKTSKKEVSVPVAVRAEVDIYLQKESATGDNTGIPGRPLLTPKAKEALDKGLRALSTNKLAEAEKYVGEAVKLA